MSRLISKLSNFGASSNSTEYDSSSSNKYNTSTRRREQVRRAQRTHRERRAKYLKGLEADVAFLRAKDASNITEIRRYRIINQRLRILLISNGITVPTEIDAVTDDEAMMSIEVMGAAGAPQSLRSPFPRKDVNTKTGAPIDTNDPQLAIDFVLALEQPCLQHYHNYLGADGEVGHSVSLSACALQNAPAPVPAGGTQVFPTGASWSVPRAQLEEQLSKLYQSSMNLQLKGEMTPIMCWVKLVERHQNAPVTYSQLWKLQQELVPQMACYGFGAIIDEEVFEYSVQNIFANIPGAKLPVT